ncbi:MAG: hypothetical protein ACREPS_08740 [Rhodanobacteraceae bacterium]
MFSLEPGHLSFTIDLAFAFLLGLIHGVTPDDHTWPITFSYAVAGYSARRGMLAGLIFSLAFAIQCAVASELAFLGLAHWQAYARFEYVVDIVVGAVMAAAGIFMMGRSIFSFAGNTQHTGRRGHGGAALRDPRPWMPALHGFVAGWGVGPFTAIVYTALAPAMPSPSTAWLPGLIFGLGTLVVQGCAGAAIGAWLASRGLSREDVRRIGLTTAARTLRWGGLAFVLYGIFGVVFPGIANIAVTTPVRIPNLHEVGIPFLLLTLVVIGIGITSLMTSVHSQAHAIKPVRR